MQDFILKELLAENILEELTSINFDKGYAPVAVDKYNYKNIKIYNLTAAQANILKQTALTVGADCATPRGTITGDIKNADCILGGSISQLKKIAKKLENQPFKLKELGQTIEEFLNFGTKDKKRTQIMGILNLTQNSFSDGGLYNNFESAVKHMEELISDGADVIDIGAESTKPYSEPIPAKIQLDKILPVLDYVKSNKITIPISIDTRSAEVAKNCLRAGAKIINDVSGMNYDKEMIKVISEFACPVVIQHSKGNPDTMQINPNYNNLMDEIYLNLKEKVKLAISEGININNIIIDPGIGFGKTREQNFEIIKRVGELKSLGCKVMLGLSRKSLLNMPEADNETKDIYTVALNTLAIENKVDIIRVHNVKLHKILLDTLLPDKK